MKIRRNALIAASLATLLSGSAALTLFADSGPVAAPSARPSAQSPSALAESLETRGLDFLKAQQQPNGTWQTAHDPPGMTAIVLKAFAQSPTPRAYEDLITKGFAALLADQKADGSVGDSLITYNTAITISALAVTNDARYKPQIDKAIGFLRELQWTDKIQGIPKLSKKVEPSDPNYGGFGYGQKGRGDNSNLQFAVDALHDAGLSSSDPAFQAALKFVSRSQNNSETNDQKWAGDDGGFIYTPGDGAHSSGGEYVGPDGRRMLRSYGAMTYAGLKSLMYAGLSKDDPRVKAAWKWVTHNWTLDEHPGLAEADPAAGLNGIFYYYHTLSRALHAYGEPVIVDSKGVSYDWRLELIIKLQSLQQPDGSWVGKQRWMEGRPILATTLALLSLEEAKVDLAEKPAR